MKANFKKYISIVLTVCLLMALVSLVACKDEEEPQNTQPDNNQTTPTVTTPTDTGTTPPEETTPEKPAETTVTFPSDEESDPRQEDEFFD